LKAARWVCGSILAVACYGYVNYGYGVNLVQEGQSLVKTLGMAAMLALGFAALILGPLALKSKPAFAVFAVLCLASVTTNLVGQELMSEQFNRDTAIWLFAERHQATNAWELWSSTISKFLAVAATFVAIVRYLAVAVRTQLEHHLGITRATRVRALGVVAYLFIPLVMVVASLRGGLAESNMIAYTVVAATLGDPEPRALNLNPTRQRFARNVVLLMDESTRPDAFEKIVAPALPSSAINYRHAYSISGCSASSNALMRWGLTRADGEVEDPRLNPSLWAFAKNAGMQTVLIDGQMTTTRDSHNLFMRREFDLLDARLAMDVGIETDTRIARALSDLTRQPGSRFIYVVLRGNHVPYTNNLPHGMRALGGGVHAEYERSVAYSTGRFFAELLADGGLDPETILFYTSDHGQDLGAPVTHCRSRAPEDDYEVPMLIVPGPARAWADALRASETCWRGGANHVNLRSTLIEAMGYAREDVEREGFNGLAHCPRDRRMPRFVGNLPFVSAKGAKLRYEWLPFRDQLPRQELPSQQSN
jgi:glucan phosphoethanolaminetransferase (alkaline phosphatase superfamily)